MNGRATAHGPSDGLPQDIGETDNDVRAARIRRGCSFVITGVVPGSIVAMLIASAPMWVSACLISTSLLGHLVRWRLQRGASTATAMHSVLILTLFGTMAPMLGLGGIDAPGKAWILVVPVLAGLIGGARVAVLYTALSLVGLAGLVVIGVLGLSPPVPMPPRMAAIFDLVQTGIVTVVVLLLIRVFMSAQRRAEQELRIANAALAESRDAAEAATAAKGAFLANMSHEIRTPMNGVIGMTTLLLDTPLNNVQREYAETTRKSANVLLAIVNDILDLSKIEAGKLKIEPVEIDLHGCIEDVGSVLAFQSAAKGIELVIDIDAGVPSRVIGDPVRLRQCLTNLLSNAIKFTERGEVVLSVAMREENGVWLTTFTVTDTGIGVPAEKLATLFTPFEQADATTTRRFGGTGLGLSIVKRLVELMGGSVGASSIEGQGSKFWFNVQLARLSAPPSEQEHVGSRRAARILVVDDNATNLKVLTAQLQQAGHTAAACASAADALQTLHEASDQNRFDIVVTDFNMPGMNGIELVKRALADAKLADVRFVLLSSVDQVTDGEALAQHRFAASLSKPVRMSQLHDCIEKVLMYTPGEWHTRSQPMVTRARIEASQTARTYSGSVLVVEDNIVNQKVARRYLEKMGLKVTLADDGTAGVKAYEAGAFDLIFMDMQMPVMDGCEATRRIRAIEAGQGRHVPIVALTADAMSQHLQMSSDAGMDAHLSKPIDTEQLRAVLQRFLGGTGAIDSESAAQIHRSRAS